MDEETEITHLEQTAVAEPDGSPKTSEPFALEPRPIAAPLPESKRADAKKKPTDKEEASQSPFSVTVGQVYDGPFDLLLDLIRKQNIDIYDIPMARITSSSFLSYTHQLKDRSTSTLRASSSTCCFAADPHQEQDDAAAGSERCRRHRF